MLLFTHHHRSNDAKEGEYADADANADADWFDSLLHRVEPAIPKLDIRSNREQYKSDSDSNSIEDVDLDSDIVTVIVIVI